MEREPATGPEELGRLVLERLNAGDVDGLVELYEPDAVLALPHGGVAKGQVEIRMVYERITADEPRFEPGVPLPVLRSGDIALTGARLADGTVTVEVARRQPDGTWRWAVDQPNLLN